MNLNSSRTLLIGVAGSAVLASVLSLVCRELLVTDVAAVASGAPAVESAALLNEIQQSLGDARAGRTRLEATLARMFDRLTSLEETTSRRSVAAEEPSPVAAAASSDGAVRTEADAEAEADAQKADAEFRDLLSKVMRSSVDSGASMDEQAAFWKGQSSY